MASTRAVAFRNRSSIVAIQKADDERSENPEDDERARAERTRRARGPAGGRSEPASSTMRADERRDRMLAVINERAFVRVDELSSQFGVSEVTARNDLAVLAERGQIVRIRGGAMPRAGLGQERPFEEALASFAVEKLAIGRAAADLIHDGESVIVDVGTTALAAARALVARTELQDVVVFTNGLKTALELEPAIPRITVVVLGGTLRPLQHSLVEPLATHVLEQIAVGTVLLGCNGIHPTRRDHEHQPARGPGQAADAEDRAPADRARRRRQGRPDRARPPLPGRRDRHADHRRVRRPRGPGRAPGARVRGPGRPVRDEAEHKADSEAAEVGARRRRDAEGVSINELPRHDLLHDDGRRVFVYGELAAGARLAAGVETGLSGIHRRLDLLTDEWVVMSPARNVRPLDTADGRRRGRLPVCAGRDRAAVPVRGGRLREPLPLARRRSALPSCRTS